MTDKQIIINDYFNIMRDENGRIFGIQEIGDIRQLIKDIREQNEYIQAKEQECEKLKKEVKKWKKFLDGGICDCETKAKSEQKLEKIKQIVNKLSLSINWNINKNAYEKLQSILQIIDEVE